jgi:hypothetical protein
MHARVARGGGGGSAAPQALAAAPRGLRARVNPQYRARVAGGPGSAAAGRAWPLGARRGGAAGRGSAFGWTSLANAVGRGPLATPCCPRPGTGWQTRTCPSCQPCAAHITSHLQGRRSVAPLPPRPRVGPMLQPAARAAKVCPFPAAQLHQRAAGRSTLPAVDSSDCARFDQIPAACFPPAPRRPGPPHEPGGRRTPAAGPPPAAPG